MHRRWLINRTNPEFVRYLSQAASVSTIFAQVLINRGLKTTSAVSDFLTQGITGLSDPFDLPGMAPAIERIKAAARRGDRVLVHGDYDTDGLTATAIMTHALAKTGLDVSYFIPTRAGDGYGFNSQAVDFAKKLGVKLIITVDCGITSFDAAARARAEGIDVIITDHHEPARRSENGFLLPEAAAVINPKTLSDSGLSILSGAGISFKVVQAMAMSDDFPFSFDDVIPLLDLAALGTLADVVPLTGENRIILKEGMRFIQDGHRPGIRALKEVCGLNTRKIKAGHLSFTVIPRINAAGRIADARDVVRLLLSRLEEETASLSSWLDGLNIERQKIEEEVYQEALEQLDATGKDPVIVLAGEGWHQGVLGIVASRIAEKFFRPTFVFSTENGLARGSARSIPAFDICEGLSECRGLILSFGGHKQAAGLRLDVSNLSDFKKTMGQIIKDRVSEIDLAPALEIDAVIELSEITHALLTELSLLDPLGCGNPEPLFGSKDLVVLDHRIVGTNHIKMKVRKNSSAVDAIGFGMGRLFSESGFPSPIDAVFSPGINEWNGGRYLQLVLRALRPSS